MCFWRFEQCQGILFRWHKAAQDILSQAHYNSATRQRIPTQDVSFNWVDMWGHLWPPTPIAKMQWFSGTRTLCRWSRMLLDIKIPEQGSSAAAKSMILVCAHIVTDLIPAFSNKALSRTVYEAKSKYRGSKLCFENPWLDQFDLQHSWKMLEFQQDLNHVPIITSVTRHQCQLHQ